MCHTIDAQNSHFIIVCEVFEIFPRILCKYLSISTITGSLVPREPTNFVTFSEGAAYSGKDPDAVLAVDHISDRAGVGMFPHFSDI